MSTIPHTGPPCLASDDDEHVPVRCTRDKGHNGDHEADDGEVVVTRWAPARFAPEVVAWARSVLASAVSGTRNDESAPTDAATSTGASPTPSEARSKTMTAILPDAADRLAQLEPHLDRLADADMARRITETRAERSVESIIEQFTITFPAPEAKRVPGWADTVGEPEWEWGEKVWRRALRRNYYFSGEGSGGVELRAHHVSTEASQRVEGIEFYINLESIDTPEEARQVALWLLEAADAVEGPKSNDVSSRHPRPMRTQQAVADRIRALLRERGLRQNELAVAAGYGADELSSLMTGRRTMDLNDVELIANALDVDPFDLIAEGAE